MAVNSTRRAVEAEERAWVSKALCKDKDPDELFVRGAKQPKAATICRHCPVMRECAADALDNKVEYGIWGGMTERQRRALLKDHPEVVSWAEFFNNRNSRFAAAPPSVKLASHSKPSVKLASRSAEKLGR